MELCVSYDKTTMIFIHSVTIMGDQRCIIEIELNFGRFRDNNAA